MMENGFSSPRSDAFPAGLRVLVVDDDPTWLRLLEKMLKKCSYEVTTCGLATDALRLLRERKDGFDIVISDVNMPDMDGFKLLEHVGLEMDLPVIMMSVDGETSRVMKGVQHGACDYLLKPIRMKELKNIWQHVFRKKIHEIRDIESHEYLEGMLLRNGSDHLDDANLLSVEELTCVRKRKDADNKHDDKDSGDASSAKKARVVWSVDLHQKFVKAVNQIGFEKVGPKKILDLMNVPWLTRENVASHLQKYRLYLTRLQKEKENEAKFSFGAATKHPAAPPKEPPGNFGLQNSDVSSGSFRFSGSLEDDLKTVVPEPPSINLPDPSFKPLEEAEVSFEAFSSSVPTKFSWTEVSEFQFRQDHKPLLHLENNFTKPPLPDPLPIPSINSKPSTAERGGLNGHVKSTKTLYPEHGSNKIAHISPTAKVDHQALEPIYATTSSMVAQALNYTLDLDCLAFGVGSPLAMLGDELQVLFHGDYAGFSDYADPELASDVRFGFEYTCYDPAEYAIIDQSLLT